MKDYRNAIQTQISKNQGLNLLFEDAPDLLEIDQEFLQQLLILGKKSIQDQELETLIDSAVEASMKCFLNVNQFLQIEQEDRNSLAGIYRQTLSAVRISRNPGQVLRKIHYPKLKTWLEEIYPDSLLKGLRNQSDISRVPCAEYSPEVQLTVLGLDPGQLLPPVLDVGCGENAHLVRYLNASGIPAQGIDRSVAVVDKDTQAVNWFNVDIQPSTWGTIISHMALSNHYQFARTAGSGRVTRMEQVFYRLLTGLKPGGILAYAPAVDGLTRLVNLDRYRISELEVVDGFLSVQILCKKG
jgi:hypothetical protein